MSGRDKLGSVAHHCYARLAQFPFRSGVSPLALSCPPLWRAVTTFQTQYPTRGQPKKTAPEEAA